VTGTDNRVTEYANRVVNGDVPSSTLVQMACQRHLRDLDDPAWVFDASTADKLFRFYGKLRHYKGEWAGNPIVLEPFQAFIIGSLFGWKSSETGLRRFRQAYLEQPRGQGKSTMAAGVSLRLAFFDREPGAEVYCCATHRAQAKITWQAAKEMVLRSGLRQRISVRVSNMHESSTSSRLEPLGADADTLDGLRPNGVILDEIHAMRSSRMVDVMTTATGTRRQPLVFEITTAGIGQTGVCWDHHDYTSKVLRGVVDDPSWFGMIIGADKDDDWTDPAVWKKANPNLGVSIKADDLERKCKKAKHIVSDEPEFRRLHLGQWVQQAEKFISLADWDQPSNAEKIDRASLRGRPCIVGMDVSSKSDFTALVALFALPNGGFAVLPTIFAPESALNHAKRESVPLTAWRREGFLRVTPGDVIDQAAIKNEVMALSKEFRLVELAFDAWNATILATELQAEGISVVEVRQGFRTLSEPTKELAALLAQGKLKHGGHPVLRWMADNLTIRQDANGNIAPDKARAAEKIDGVVALIMALTRRGQLRDRPPGPRERGILLI